MEEVKLKDEGQKAILPNPVLPAVFVGQILYLERSNRNAPSEIEEVTVQRIGKKYFYLNGWEERYPIGKENLLYESKEYSQHNFQLYRTKQEILDRKERANLISKLKAHFDWHGNSSKNTLEQLRSAVDVLCVGENGR